MTEQQARRNILLYRLHVIFNDGLFLGVLMVTYLEYLGGLTVSQIFILMAVSLLIQTALDIPLGMVADYIGRKRTLVAARIVALAGSTLFAFMTGGTTAWLAVCVIAAASAMQSGADSSLLFETLRSQHREMEYKNIRGSAYALRLAIQACCTLVAGAIATIDLRLPLLIGLPFTAVPLLAALWYVDPPRSARSASAHEHWNNLKLGMRAMAVSPHLRWIIAFAATLAITTQLWQWSNPYYELVGLPLWLFGVVGFASNMGAAIGSKYAETIEKVLGERNSIILLILGRALPTLAMSLVPHPFMAALVPSRSIVHGFTDPFVGDYLHRRVEDAYRTTALSVCSTAENLVGIVGRLVFALVIVQTGLLHTVTIMALATLVFGGWSYRTYVKISQS